MSPGWKVRRGILNTAVRPFLFHNFSSNFLVYTFRSLAMDPLSLTASIIAIIGVGGHAARLIKRVASLKDASELILALNNEISDLRLVVSAIQDIFEKQRADSIQFPGSTTSEIDANTSVTNTLCHAKEKSIELDALCRRLGSSALGASGSTSINKMTWLREQRRVGQIQEDLRSIRLKLNTALGVLTSYVKGS